MYKHFKISFARSTSELLFVMMAMFYFLSSIVDRYLIPISDIAIFGEWFTPFVTMLLALFGFRLRMIAQRAEYDWAEHQRSIEEAKKNRAAYTREARFPNTPSTTNWILSNLGESALTPLAILFGICSFFLQDWQWVSVCVVYLGLIVAAYYYQKVKRSRHMIIFVFTLSEQMSLLEPTLMSAGKIGKFCQCIEYAKMVAPDSFSDEEIEIWRKHQRKANEPVERRREIATAVETIENASLISNGRLLTSPLADHDRNDFVRICSLILDKLPVSE